MERTLQDKFISSLDTLRFRVSEPMMLRLMRFNHSFSYQEKKVNPLISVCVPTYNRSQLLMDRAIPSVLSQTYENFELIIIGDHCTDDTEKLVSQIKDPRIRFYNLPTRTYRYPPSPENHWLAGPVVANNKGLEMVKGKWIARIDDDDLWTKDHLSSLLDFAQREDFEFVSSLYEREQYGKKEIVAGQYLRSPYFDPKLKKTDTKSPQVGGVQTWLYRSYLSFFKYNLNCWRKSWNRVNDIDLQYRIYQAGTKIGFLGKVTASILPRPGEQTIGLKAYKQSAEEKLKHYEFKH